MCHLECYLGHIWAQSRHGKPVLNRSYIGALTREVANWGRYDIQE
jgi:hypothetical protein